MLIQIYNLNEDKIRELKEFCNTNNIEFINSSDEKHTITRVYLDKTQVFIADDNNIIIGVKEFMFATNFIAIGINEFFYIELA